MDAVTVHVPVPLSAVKVEPSIEQLPEATVYVTAPEPNAPVMLNAEVPLNGTDEGVATAAIV